MESKIWFILNDGQVTGPFHETEVQSQLNSIKDPQIWGRGQTEWMTPMRWIEVIKNASPMANQKSRKEGLWRIRIDGKEKPALPYSELIHFLKSITDLSAVDVCVDESENWKDLYSYPELIHELGISRRAHPRVPIAGNLQCDRISDQTECRVISISEGGMGVNNAYDFKIGERFRGTLTSDNLFVTITSECEVVYIGKNGYAGIRFIGLPPEFKSSIIEYVNKFATT